MLASPNICLRSSRPAWNAGSSVLSAMSVPCSYESVKGVAEPAHLGAGEGGEADGTQEAVAHAVRDAQVRCHAGRAQPFGILATFLDHRVMLGFEQDRRG